jgi:hypothetical protein
LAQIGPRRRRGRRGRGRRQGAARSATESVCRTWPKRPESACRIGEQGPKPAPVDPRMGRTIVHSWRCHPRMGRRSGAPEGMEQAGYALSPFDSSAGAEFDAQAMSHLLHGRYEKACLQPTSPFKPIRHTASPMRSWPAALARLGRLDEARAAAARALELLPAFRYSSQFAGVNYAPALAGVLGGTPDCQSSLANCRDVFSLASDAPLSFEFGASTSGSECYLALKRKESTSR